MRSIALLALLLSCDPVNKITVSFPVEPASHITAWWVQTYQGRSYASTRLFDGDAPTADFSVTRSECCGTAAAYRNDDLHFIACVAHPGADLALVCGAPADPPAKLVHSTAKGTCADLHLTSMDIALATCTLTPTAGATPPPSASPPTP